MARRAAAARGARLRVYPRGESTGPSVARGTARALPCTLMKCLIADDDDIVRLLLNTALTKLGLEVTEVENGHEAWEAWQTGEFPLVISDWTMPGLDGLEFCRRIRAEQREGSTYIILLTAHSGKANYLEGMAAGADDFVTKPFE